MKRFFLHLAISCACIATTIAQPSGKIKELEKERLALQKQITESETLLLSAKKDISSQLGNLALVTNQIEERRTYIQAIETDIKALGEEIQNAQHQLETLNKELDNRKKNYAASLQYMQFNNRSETGKLMFILSAKDFNQMYRRLRYVREYAEYQQMQGKEIEKKQKQITQQQQELKKKQQTKTNLLQQNETEKQKLEKQEEQEKNILNNLKKRQSALQKEINKKRKQAQQLNARIDKLIELEIANAKKKAEAETKRETATGKKQAQPSQAEKTGKGNAPVETYAISKNDLQLSSNFEKNKGLLPAPITGPYLIVSHYGQYNVKGLKNVQLDNKGIDIQGKEGAMARAIFNGEVSAVFQYNGLTGILIRHGNYISVYCNLSSATVSKGDKVETKDIIGEVYPEDGRPILHFQLRKETTKLNPEYWIGK